MPSSGGAVKADKMEVDLEKLVDTECSDRSDKPKKEKKKDKKQKKEKSDKKDKKEKRKRSSSSGELQENGTKVLRVDEDEGACTNGVEANGTADVTNGDATAAAGDPMAVDNFRLCDTVKGMLKEKGFEKLFPIQAQTLDSLLDGFDVVGRARTGSGKTLAFVLPIVERLRADPWVQQQIYGRPPSVLVLAPTRELAKQVSADFEWIGKAANLVTTCIYGGTPMQPQERALHQGIDVLVGTPGRIKDHYENGSLILGHLKYQILDECDQMLNMGFVEDVELLLNAVENRENVQTLLFSATLPRWVSNISKKFLKPEFKTIDLVGESKMQAAQSVRHAMIPCHYKQRDGLIQDLIRCYSGGRNGRTIVFAETKLDCDEVCGAIGRELGAKAIHGDIPQAQREVALAGFRNGQFSVLVATDVAARGLDISGVELVVQCHPPKDYESYIHRSGRTGRAGKTGMSIVLVDRKHEYQIPYISKQAGVKFERLGAPQPEDMARVAADNAADDIMAVDKEVVKLFRETAGKVIESFDSPEDAMAAALACITGHTEVKRRSLLTATEGWTTLLMKAPNVRVPGFIFGPLRSGLPSHITENVNGATVVADGSGVVFDVPDENLPRFLKSDFKHYGKVLEVSKIATLPELQPKTESYSNGGGRNGGYGRFGGGRFTMGRSSGGRGRGRGSFGGGGGRGFRGGGGGRGRGRW